jgi:hypothetical protein
MLWPIENQDGSRSPIKARNGRIDGDQYFDDVARGLIPGARDFGAYGYFETGGAVSNNVIQPQLLGSSINIAPVGGVQMQLASTSPSDGPGGTGIRSVHIHYIDGNGYDADEDILTNGTTPVLTSALDIRFVQCLHMSTFGSNKSAVGNITLSSGGIVYSVIVTGGIRCSSSARMVPFGHLLLVKNISAGTVSGTSARCEIQLGCTVFEGHDYTESGVLVPVDEWLLKDTSATPLMDMPYAFPAGSVVALQVNSDKAATVSASFRGVIEYVE